MSTFQAGDPFDAAIEAIGRRAEASTDTPHAP
jgi:hypothetical protein